MIRHCSAIVLIVLVALFAQPARAFFDQPWITPAMPTAGELVSVSIHGGVCDALLTEPGYPQITQQGNAIRMLRFGQHWPEGSGDLPCSYPIGTATYAVGTYPPGHYILAVDLAYIDFFGMPGILTIGIVPFTVAGAPAAAVPAPAISPIALLILALGLALTAWHSRTRRKVRLIERSMLNHRRTRWLALFVAFFTQSAQAFFDPPWITPANPTVGDIVSVNIHGGICDAIFGREGFPQITRVGNAIRIVEYGHHWDDQELCIYGVGTVTDPIGAFPPGDYTLTVDFTYSDFLPEPAVVTLGVVPFTVTGAQPAAVAAPTSGAVALVALSLSLGLTAWLWQARRRRRASK